MNVATGLPLAYVQWLVTAFFSRTSFAARLAAGDPTCAKKLRAAEAAPVLALVLD
jgi:hypothetical protein